MDRNFRVVLLGICGLFFISSSKGQVNNGEIAELKHLKKVKVINDLKKEAGKKIIPDEKVRDEKGAVWKNGISPQPLNAILDSTTNFNDPGKQEASESFPNISSGELLTSIPGLPYSNVVPPDPSLAVGPNHIIQMLNGTTGSIFMVMSKSGNVLIPATTMDQVTGIGGFADPIALYDHLADRFIMMEMVNVGEAGSYGLSLAITQTPDPTGAWDVFFLNTGANMPDYPKIAMWPDAYYITANEFTNASAYAGTFAYAIERNPLLQGLSSPKAVRIRLGIQSKHSGACPVTLQGNPSNAESNGLIAWLQDDIWSTWDEYDTDSIGFFKFNVNWANPGASNITTVASLSSLPFKSNVCTAGRGRCIPQTGTSIMLEALHQKIMNQPVYRAFQGFEGVVMTHTTDAGNEQAGVRWYELRRYLGQENWTIGQQSTWSPDVTHRFMPTISYNYRGDIGLAYNVSDGTGTYPGIRFTGRRSCDAPGLMTIPENSIIEGGYPSISSRFGDYSHMVTDAITGNFWLTSQYMPTNLWATRIAQFKIDSCIQVCDVPYNLYSKNLTPLSATLSWTISGGANYYQVEYKADTASNWIDAGTTIADSLNLDNLHKGEYYTWRIKSHCDFNNGAWITATFSTPLEACNPPAWLNTAHVTQNSAKVSWTKIANARSYNLEYQPTGAATWINLPIAETDTLYNLSGLTGQTHYTWRVRTNCLTNSSNWESQSFTTSFNLCQPPSGLSAADITSGSAQLNWAIVPGATAYRVEFQKNGASAWTVLTLSTPANTVYLSGTAPGTLYNWRVSATCSQNTTGFSQASFITTGSCNTPGSPKTTNISHFGATLSWSGVKGTLGYRIEYKSATENTWMVLNNSTAISYNLSGLPPGTAFQWRVRNICAAGTSAPSAIQTFNSLNTPCPDPYEPNNSKLALTPIQVKTDLFASIGAGTDQDWYSFYNTQAEPNIQITLSQLPANYTIILFSPSGRSVAKVANPGNADRIISYNTTTTGKYWIQIFPASSSVFDPSKCYKLGVNIQSGTNLPEPDPESGNNYMNVSPGITETAKEEKFFPDRLIKVFPNPAKECLNVVWENPGGGNTILTVIDQTGRVCKEIAVKGGHSSVIDVSRLPVGLYMVQVKTENWRQIRKILIHQ